MARKISSALLTVVILLSLVLSGCNRKNENLYELGIDVTKVMGEMVESEEYASIMYSAIPSEIIDDVKSDDYDSPIAVYAIEMPKTEELLKFVFDSDTQLWNSLSNELQEQVKNRISFAVIASAINSRQGSQMLAFSSLYTASKEIGDLNIDATTIYLYVFEKGTPIVVTFTTSGYANGQFLFMDDLDSLSDVRNAFAPYKCTVSAIEIK